MDLDNAVKVIAGMVASGRFGTSGNEARDVLRFLWSVWQRSPDKLHHVLGTVNPVAGPYFNFTFPEPTGVVGVIAPEEPALLGLVSRVAPEGRVLDAARDIAAQIAQAPRAILLRTKAKATRRAGVAGPTLDL